MAPDGEARPGEFEIDTLVLKDPFRVQRVAFVPTSVDPPREPVMVERVQLVGTVLDSELGDVALCVVGSRPPVSVRVGARVGDLVLRSVAQGKAVFAGPEGNLRTLHVLGDGER